MGRIQRRNFLIATATLVAAPFADAQQVARTARVGFLRNSASAHLREALLQGLRDLGYVEGHNLLIELRQAEGNLKRFPALAAELVALKVEVIVALTTPAAQAAKQATKTIPIVFVGAGDPVASGLVATLARPGGNITGLSSLNPELVGKCLQQLKQVVPTVKRVAVLWHPGGLGERLEREMLREAEVAVKALGLQLQIVEARATAEFDRAFHDMATGSADALTVLPSILFNSEAKRLADLATRGRLPAVYQFREYVDAGGLMAYGASLTDLTRRAATYVDKVLKGAKPGELPVEQPTKFELVINLKTAKALGIIIPQSVLARADEVIQ